MKTVLRSVALMAISLFCVQQSFAQCTVSNIIIQNVVRVGSTATTCTVKFDVSFNIENNSGNKYIFLHTWLQSQYPNYFDCVDGHPTTNGSIAAPESADLANSFLNIGIDNNSPTPTIITTYPPDNAVPLAMVDGISKTVLADGSAVIILTGVTVTVPVACGTPVVIIADLWSSQSASAQRAHCVNCGIKYSAGYLRAAGLVNCSSMMYGGTITNTTNTSINGYYRVFADVNGDGYFSPAIDTLLINNTNVTVAANSSLGISGAIPGVNINQDVFIVFTQTSGDASGASMVTRFQSTQCSPLPVTFKSLNATRTNRSNVLLTWETATEINNNGFVIQRNMGNDWQMVSFVPSQAVEGNSSSTLVYTFNDNNSNKGISQYRIKQVDLDGKARFSQIRAVRGESQNAKMIVFPNPSANGQVSVVFEEKQGTRDVTLSDLSGRLIKQWKGISYTTIQMDNLKPGMYMLQVIVKETGYTSTEKIIVTQ